jgi:hypothetical protein
MARTLYWLFINAALHSLSRTPSKHVSMKNQLCVESFVNGHKKNCGNLLEIEIKREATENISKQIFVSFSFLIAREKDYNVRQAER